MARQAHRRWQGLDRERQHAPVVVRQAPTKTAEPMTPGQRGYLKDLCRESGTKFNPKWTKVQASKMIQRLKAKTGRRQVGR